MRILICFAVVGLVLSGQTVAAPAELLADHPLSGSLWDTRSGRQVEEAALLSAAASADWVLIGEKHDNAAHHRLQARIVAALADRGRRLAVVWEMAEPEHAGILAAARLETVDALGEALDWEARGWPAWSEYQPIAEAALAAGLPMLPGKPSSAQVRALADGEPLPLDIAARLAWPKPYSAEMEDELLDELAAGHCGKLPAKALGRMVEVQRFWDAWMADAMRRATQPPVNAQGVILIAGAGHVREDRAVPWHLPGDSVTMALVEVAAGRERVADYPAFDARRFDYVWFTPRVDEKDPCADFPD